jgi:hypothetical protein
LLTVWADPVSPAEAAMMPTPATALMKLGKTLVDCIQGLAPPGWKVLWDLDPEQTIRHDWHFQGNSLGGAAAVALWLLVRKMVANPDFLLIAGAEGDRLTPAAREEGKFEAALRDGRIKRLGLPRGHHLAAEQISEFSRQMQVTQALETVEDAAKLAAQFPGAPTGPLPATEPRYLRDALSQTLLEWVRRSPRAIHYNACSLRAPRGCGKSTEARQMETEAQRLGHRVVVVEGRILGRPTVNEIAQRFLLAVQAGLPGQRRWTPPDPDWLNHLFPCLEWLTRQADSPLMIVLDNCAEAIDSDIGEEFFIHLRAVIIQAEAEGLCLRIVLLTAVDPSRLVKNILNSPFNGVGEHQTITFNRWGAAEVARLNDMQGRPLSEEGLKKLLDFAGGHPALSQICLHVSHGVPEAELNSIWYGCQDVQNHLNLVAAELRTKPELQTAFDGVLDRGEAPQGEAQLLEMMGLCRKFDLADVFWCSASKQTKVRTQITCRLYRLHFRGL